MKTKNTEAKNTRDNGASAREGFEFQDLSSGTALQWLGHLHAILVLVSE